MKKFAILASLLISLSVFAEKREITIVNYETDGLKQWLPGTIVVKKGDEVELTLINNVPSGTHGFTIPAFKVVEVVLKGKPKKVKFVADKDGIFPMKCQMHGPHIGGQLIVMP